MHGLIYLRRILYRSISLFTPCWTLLLLWATYSKPLKAQPYYFQFDTLIGSAAIPDLLCDTCDFIIPGPLLYNATGGLSFGPDGHIYGLSSVPDNIIYQVNLQTNTTSIVFQGGDNTVQMGGFMAVGGGIFYSIPHLTSNVDSLYLWDTNVDTMGAVGLLPYPPYGELWQVNGEIYYLSWDGAGPREIIRLQPDALEESEPVMEFPAHYVIYGLTATPVANILIGVDHSYFSPGKHMVSLNLTDASVQKLCRLRKPYSHGGWSLTSISEHAESEFYLQLDLDCDNSSGATGNDFNATPFDCFNSGGVAIADNDIKILMDALITSLTLNISNPEDGADEILTLAGNLNGIVASGEGTSTLVLQSEGAAKTTDFIEALQLVRYDNLALGPTGGQRLIEAFFETASGSTCDIAIANVTVNELEQLEVDLGPDVELCEGESWLLDPGSGLVTYAWSTGQNTSAIEVTEEGIYSVTVSSSFKCPHSDDIDIAVLPNYVLIIEGDSVACLGNEIQLSISTDAPFPLDIELTAEPGGSNWYFDIVSGHQISFTPSVFTDYYVSSVIPSQSACIDLTAAYQTVDISPGFSFTDSISICAGDSILLGTSWQTLPGDYPVTLDALQGCDTLAIYTLSWLPAPHLESFETTCDSADAGLFTIWLPDPLGCDTLWTRHVNWVEPDTIILQSTTCRFADSGQFIQVSPDQYGCDSVTIQIIDWIPASDSTYLTFPTCDTSLTGTTYTWLNGVNGCDSMVVITTEPGQADTTFLHTTSCDSSSLGVHISTFVNVFLCDSVVVTQTNYAAQDSTFLVTSTCDPDAAGHTIAQYVNRFGCDSIVSTHILLSPQDTAYIETQTCDAEEAGITEYHFQNQFGCDSTVFYIAQFVPPSSTYLTATSCLAQDTGQFVTILQNQFGCDSNIILHVMYSPADTSNLIYYTCDPELISIETLIVQGQDLCDSVIITQTVLFELPQLVIETSDYNGYGVRCAGQSDGNLIAHVEGIPPFTYTWSTGDVGHTLHQVPAGTYALEVKDGQGCTTSGFAILTTPDPLNQTVDGFIPLCSAGFEGFIQIQSSGGVAPYVYAIDSLFDQLSGYFGSLGPGAYTCTTIDANQCRTMQTVILETSSTEYQIDLGADLAIEPGNSVLLVYTTDLPVVEIVAVTWSGSDGTFSQCSSCSSLAVIPGSTTQYHVQIEDVNGCIYKDSLIVSVFKEKTFHIPNVFSPNGDGNNDDFNIPAGVIAGIKRLDIFDRWGNQVFGAVDYLPGDPVGSWNGTFDGAPLAPGVFVFKLIYITQDGRLGIKTGDLTLIR